MNLAALFVPVKDLKAALAFYRDTLGFEETWREGETTCGLRLPGTEIELMIDQTDAEVALGTGPFFHIDDVRAFVARNQDIFEFVDEPQEIPPGYAAAFRDPTGNVVRVFDTVKESTP